jgi:hypothetical protein
MPDELRVQDLETSEIAELLARSRSELTAEQADAVRDFVDSIGGSENAVHAIEMLRDLEDAA